MPAETDPFADLDALAKSAEPVAEDAAVAAVEAGVSAAISAEMNPTTVEVSGGTLANQSFLRDLLTALLQGAGTAVLHSRQLPENVHITPPVAAPETDTPPREAAPAVVKIVTGVAK